MQTCVSLSPGLEAKQVTLLNENYNHQYFKERLTIEGYTTLVRKFEKRSNLRHWIVKSNNCTAAYSSDCSCKTTAKNFERHGKNDASHSLCAAHSTHASTLGLTR